MELNTNIYGIGVHYRGPSDFKCASDLTGTTAYNIRNLTNENKIKINEKIDSSIFYTWSYGSTLCGYAYVKPLLLGASPDVVRHDSPFANYMFMTYFGYDPDSKNTMDYSSANRIGYGLPASAIISSDRYIYTRYALARMRFCCIVEYFTVDRNNVDNVPYYTGGGRLPLKDFLADTSLQQMYDNNELIVYRLSWESYATSTQTSTTMVPYSTELTVCHTIDIKSPDDRYVTDNIYFPHPQVTISQGGSTALLDPRDLYNYNYLFTNTSSKWSFEIMGRSGTSAVQCVASLPYENLISAFHEFAFTGLYYTNNRTTAQKTTLSDSDLFLGVMSPITGGTSGKYIQFSYQDSEEDSRGKAREANAPAVDDVDPMSDPNPVFRGQDDPSQVDPNNYVNKIELSRPTLSTVDVFNRSYAITAASLRVLADDLWNADDDKFTEIVDGLKLMGENPMNGLIDCRLYPFDLTQMVQTAGSQQIVIGRTTLTVSGVKLTNDINTVIDLGSCKFMAYNNSFLDYSPYTTARLVLPYCGTIPIDCAEFVGHTITAKMIVDIITGACCCCVFLDNVLTITAQGVCGVSIPMTGTDSASYASGVVSGLANAVTGVINAGVGIATGNVLQAGAGVAEVLGGAAKATQTPVQYAQSGTATPSCNNWLPQMAYFVVDSPIPNVPDDYGHCVGFACEIYDTLNNFSGFTVITNPDLAGFNATETEKDMIRSLMQEGIYL